MNYKKRTIFVTGGTGLLGKVLIPLLEQAGYSVFAPSHQEFDIISPPKDFFVDKKFDLYINLAAFTNVELAETSPELALSVNRDGVRWLLQLPIQSEIYHLSTDYVYDGLTPNSKESDIPKPFNWYGVTKALGDLELLSHSRPNIRIIRTAFKPDRWVHPLAFTDVFTNAEPISIAALRIASFILASPPAGIYNVGGPPTSMYDLAKTLNNKVKPGLLLENNFPYIRPHLTMDLSKYWSLGI